MDSSEDQNNDDHQSPKPEKRNFNSLGALLVGLGSNVTKKEDVSHLIEKQPVPSMESSTGANGLGWSDAPLTTDMKSSKADFGWGAPTFDKESSKKDFGWGAPSVASESKDSKKADLGSDAPSDASGNNGTSQSETGKANPIPFGLPKVEFKRDWAPPKRGSGNSFKRQRMEEPSEFNCWAETRKFNDDGEFDPVWLEHEHKKLDQQFGVGIVTVKYTEHGTLGYYCELCFSTMNAMTPLEMHCSGMKHLKKKDIFDKNRVTGDPGIVGLRSSNLNKPREGKKNKWDGPDHRSSRGSFSNRGRGSNWSDNVPGMGDRPYGDVYPDPYRSDRPLDPYAKGDPYLGSSVPHGREDPFLSGSSDPYAARNDPYGSLSSDPYAARNDPYGSSSADPYTARNDPYRSSSSEPYAREDPYKSGSRDPYLGSDEASPYGRKIGVPPRSPPRAPSIRIPSPPRARISPPRARISSPVEVQSGGLAGGPAAILITRLAQCSVKNEEDASLASNVISLLLKSLKDYRTKLGEKTIADLMEQAEIKLGTAKAIQSVKSVPSEFRDADAITRAMETLRRGAASAATASSSSDIRRDSSSINRRF